MKRFLVLTTLLISMGIAAQGKVSKQTQSDNLTKVSEMKGKDNVRVYAAAENHCKPKDIRFLKCYETKKSGYYTVAVAGKVMKYKTIGKTCTRVQ